MSIVLVCKRFRVQAVVLLVDRLVIFVGSLRMLLLPKKFGLRCRIADESDFRMSQFVPDPLTRKQCILVPKCARW
jgi:hypothetical protein